MKDNKFIRCLKLLKEEGEEKSRRRINLITLYKIIIFFDILDDYICYHKNGSFF
jgi:hypothetical protein